MAIFAHCEPLSNTNRKSISEVTMQSIRARLMVYSEATGWNRWYFGYLGTLNLFNLVNSTCKNRCNKCPIDFYSNILITWNTLSINVMITCLNIWSYAISQLTNDIISWYVFWFLNSPINLWFEFQQIAT